MSKDFNEITIIGNIGKDPDLKYFESEKKLCRITVATAEKPYFNKSGDQVTKTNWHNVIAWNSLASYLSHAKKGQRIFVKGTLEHEEYDGKTFTQIKANTIIYL